MKTIEATYRIVTPMFIGGANQDPSDGIRPPPFKGALRFWWRALNWSKYQDLTALHKKECELFGSAAKTVNGSQVGGQGKFLLKIKQPESSQDEEQWPQATPLKGSGYLGMELWESGSKEKRNYQPHRVAISSKNPFKVYVTFRDTSTDEDIEQVLQSLKVLGLVGGLGSRSRRGFGSIAIQYIQEKSYICDSAEKYQHYLKEEFSPEPADMLPPFTAWSKLTRIGFLKQKTNDAKAVHKKASELFYQVRGMKAEVRGTDKRGFGQPLPLKPIEKKYDTRRASPLFFHIHPIGNQYICSHLFMPAQFLPNEGFDMDFFSGVNHYMDKLQEVAL